MSLSIFTIILLLLCTTTFAQAQFDESTYASARIDTISFFPVHLLNDTLRFIVLDTPLKLRTQVILADSTRLIDELSLKVLEEWLSEVIQRPEYIEFFKHEILVSQGEKSLWFPIQESIIEPLREKIPKGSSVDLYVTLAGATKDRIILSVNGFDPVQ